MVENYFNQELSDITFEVEALDEWKSIAEELGMENQLSLTKGKESPIPYPFMNEVMMRVYETLCPSKEDYKKYKKTTIPLDVLKQIAMSVRDNHFKKIEVWYDDKDPDPLVVGSTFHYHCSIDGGNAWAKDKREKYINFETEEDCKKWCEDNNEKFYSASPQEKTHYLIARWGDELRPFSELKEIAYQRLIEDVGSELERTIKEKQTKLNLLKENVRCYLNGQIRRYDLNGSW